MIYYHSNDNGIGSEIHCIQLAITAAMLTNRTLIIAEDYWTWADPGVCQGKGWSCYFKPLSNCPNPIPGDKRQEK